MEVFATQDAIDHYERARNLLAEALTGARQLAEPSIQDLEHLYIQLGRAYEMSDEWRQSRAAYEALLALGRELGEARLEVVSLNHLAVLDYHQGDIRLVRTLLEEARTVAEEAGFVEALAETECNLADVMTFWVGESKHSRPLAQKALASARTLERPDLVARALVALARVEVFRGRLEESAAHAEEGAALSRQLAERPRRGRSFLRRRRRSRGSRPPGRRATRPLRYSVSPISRTPGSSKAGCKKGSRSEGRRRPSPESCPNVSRR